MRLACLLSVFVFSMLGQAPQDLPPVATSPPDSRDVKLPNGKSQREEIVKADYKKNLEDAAKLVQLSQDVREALENGDRYVVSVRTIKQLDEIDKLSRSIRGRLKRY
ncbi:MAG TPA: hypothetical protein VH639_26665 [Bryobacteraceae bacterium]|jgi:hypothetical protein